MNFLRHKVSCVVAFFLRRCGFSSGNAAPEQHGLDVTAELFGKQKQGRKAQKLRNIAQLLKLIASWTTIVIAKFARNILQN